MKYEIYQIENRRLKQCPYSFRNWNEAEDNFSMTDYTKVYEGTLIKTGYLNSDNKVLEKLYFRFNVDHPEDYKGRSLSVSDVVKIDDRIYYCNMSGWEKIINK